MVIGISESTVTDQTQNLSFRKQTIAAFFLLLLVAAVCPSSPAKAGNF